MGNRPGRPTTRDQHVAHLESIAAPAHPHITTGTATTTHLLLEAVPLHEPAVLLQEQELVPVGCLSPCSREDVAASRMQVNEKNVDRTLLKARGSTYKVYNT